MALLMIHTLAHELQTLHIESLHLWTQQGLNLTHIGLMGLIEENHAFNFQLWNTEDCARRDDLGYEYVYRAKRSIDGFNQQRNNRMEAIDLALVEHLKPASHLDCPVHSETPGMMIDRLSILSLKAYHMNLQACRENASPEHRQNCQRKSDTIIAQRQQLTQCLAELIEDVLEKRRTFRLYHQFKMYNDPNLNPELYTNQSSKTDVINNN